MTTDAKGHYQLTVAPQDIYRISIAAKGFFNIHQTFSHYELSLKHASKFSISDITLVKKVQRRTLLAFGGDVMMGRRYAKPYFNNPVLIHADSIQEDTKALVKQIKPYMSAADFAAVNLETQIASEQPDQRAPKSVTFFSPPQTLDALQWAGIDYVTLGNNHTYDYLDSGLKSSLDWLKKSQLGYSGAGINEQQALAPYRTSLNGNEFSMLGFVGWEGGFSPNQTASHDKGGAAFGSMTNITNTVKTESAANRATVVQYHGSQEYAPEPTLMTEQRLKSAIDHGADLAIAHHPHVTQGFELYNGKLIAYSMGNFIFDQFFYSTPHSFILYVWMDGETFHRAEIVPIYLKGYQPTPSTGAHRDNVLKRLTQLSKKRGVIIGMSGGHGVINSKQSSQENTSTHLLSVNTSIEPLPLGHWSKQLSGIASDTNGLKYRLGVNLVNGSDFETFGSFDSDERGWNIDDNKFTLTSQDAFSGQYAMNATLAAQASDSLAMTNFRRVYRGGNPMSITLKVKYHKTLN